MLKLVTRISHLSSVRIPFSVSGFKISGRDIHHRVIIHQCGQILRNNDITGFRSLQFVDKFGSSGDSVGNRLFSSMNRLDEEGKENLENITKNEYWWVPSVVLRKRHYVPLAEYTRIFDNMKLLEMRLKANSDCLWQVTVRATIEEFEDRFGDDAKIDYQKISASSWFEWNRIVREARFNWMFENRQDVHNVNKLITAINGSDAFKNYKKKKPTEVFAYFIAVAYNELSHHLKKKLVAPGNGKLDFVGLTLDNDANEAIRIFMAQYDFGDVTVIKKE